MKQHGMHDVKVTDNTRAIRCRWGLNYLRIILLINCMMEENLFVNVVSCKACSFTVFCQKKCHKKKKRKPRWTDISGPGPVSFLSRSSMYYITLTLHNPIGLLNVVITNSFSWAYYKVYKQVETAGTCSINSSNQNPFVFSPSCQE